MKPPDPIPQLTLDQLATAAGLPARTVRYYIQLGLVDRPVGEKRAAYYTPAHLEQLLTVQKWSEGGLSLESIRRLMAGELPEVPPEPRGRVEVRSHMTVTDGVELVIEPGRARLTPAQVRRLFAGVLELHERIAKEADHER
jgi:DNA-binding transcriptional MerR regulator